MVVEMAAAARRKEEPVTAQAVRGKGVGSMQQVTELLRLA